MTSPPKDQPNRGNDPSRPDGGSGGPDNQPGEAPRSSSSGMWMFVLLLFLVLIYYMYQKSPGATGSRVSYSFFWEQVNEKNVKTVRFVGEVLTGKWNDVPDPPEGVDTPLEPEFNTIIPDVDNPTLLKRLIESGVEIAAEPTDIGVGTQMMFWLLGPLLIIAFFWFMLRRSADPMGSGMLGSFIRSPAKRFRPSEQQTTFEDVAAMEQAKGELQEVVEFLKDPSKFQRLGAQIPKGVLLVGPPGTGKTLLARATAGEAGVPFFSINGSEFIQMFVGVGASRVRDMFRTAKDSSPCILFIDEIDAVGRIRGAGVGGGHDEREQTLNQILSEMDGFQQSEAVIVVAATNRPDVLDPALLRPGRFDRHVTVDRPTRDGRLGILKVHCRKVPLADTVDLADVASSTIGFSGADLRNLVNEAALTATRHDKDRVDGADFEQARDRVLMGPPREEVLNDDEKEMTAYHEAGHALLAWLLPGVDPVHKVTIIPRGRALGVTQLLPDEERYHIGERKLHAQLAMILAGRAAEKAVFDEFSAGAEDDLKKATQLARRMVGHWGMSDVIGPVAFRQADEHPFLGKEMHEAREFSEETAHIIDQEVQRFLTNAADRAFKILTERRADLDRLAQALLENEMLGKDELIELIGERATAASDAL